MFLAIAFGLFLAVPLAVLAWSVGHTAVGVSRGDDLAAAAVVGAPVTADAPVVVAGRRVTMSKGAVLPTVVAAEAQAGGTLLEFPLRDEQLAKLRGQYAAHA